MRAIGASGTPVKYLAREVKDLNLSLEERNLLSLSYGRIIRKDIESNEGLLPANFERYTVVRPGDVVLRLTDLQNDQRSLRTGLVKEPGIITSAYLTLRPQSTVDSRYFAYALHAVDVAKVFYTLGGGLRQSMGMEEVGGLRLALPPLEEQRRIADFLDDQVSLIHTVMEARDRQNALLRLELQTEISELVLGAESKRVQLRRLIQRRPDYGANAAAEFENREWPRFIRTTDIAADGGLREETFRSLPPEVAEDYLLEDGDVLFTRSGSVGKSFIYRWAWGPAAFAGYLIRVSTDRSRLLPEWLKAFAETDSYWAQIRESAIQATIPNVNAERYSGLMLPVPPLIEQEKRIVNVQRVQELAQARNEALDRSGRLLEEFRVAIITAAVTGELDVTTARRGIPA